MVKAEMTKTKNIAYLKRIFGFKRVSLGIILLAERLRILLFIAPLLNSLLKLIGIKKNVYTYSNYRRFGKAFKNAFNKTQNQNKQVLFPMMFGNNSNFNLLNLILAKYLEVKGYHPVFLVCNSSFSICGRERIGKTRDGIPFFCHECYGGYKKLAKQTGIDIQFMDSFNSPEIQQNYLKEASKIEKLKSNIDCLDFKMSNGFKIGHFTKKRILRYFYHASLTDSNDELTIYKHFLKEGVKYYFLLESYLKINNNTRSIILHNGTLAYGIYLFDIVKNKNIDVITYETFLGNNSFIYKKNDEVMKLNWLAEMKKYYEKTPLTNENKKCVVEFFEGLRGGKDLYALLNKEHDTSKLKHIKEYVCLFTNLNYDTAVLDRNSIFSSMEQWIFEVIDYWQNFVSDISLVIRVHPAEVKLITPSRDFIGEKIKKRIKKSNIILIDSNDQVNSYKLIEGMKFGLVYASTIGLEAAYNNKICLIAGDTYYKNESFVISPESKDKYFKVLGKFLENEELPHPDKESLYHFIYYIYFKRVNRLKNIYLQYTGKVETQDIPDYSNILSVNESILEKFYNECFS